MCAASPTPPPAAFCQGQGGRGFLGNGGTQDSCEALVPVAGDYTWQSLSVAYDYACGITTDGDGGWQQGVAARGTNLGRVNVG